jgi:hypothetical protein
MAVESYHECPEYTRPMSEGATVREVIQRHHEQSGIAPDGGLSDRWVVIRLGRIPMPFLNTSARRRALTLHDVNHLVACFGTGNVGEAEISAWELASGGCGPYVAAWGLDLAGLLLGMVWPIHVVRAFAAGRSTGNAYAFDLEEILDLVSWIDRPVCCLPATRHSGWSGVPGHGGHLYPYLGTDQGRGNAGLT